MAEPTITCPNCSADIPLTESLAAPLLKKSQERFEQALAKKDRDLAAREETVRERLAEVERSRASIDDQIAQKISAESKRIAEHEAAKARRLSAQELEAKAQEIADLNALVQDREGKLAIAQKAQAEVARKERELEDARREMDLIVQSKVQAEIGNVRAAMQREFEDSSNARVAIKEEQIASMQREIDERDGKLAIAQKAQADVVRKERELENARREMELTIQTRISAELDGIRAKARQDAEEAMKLPLVEKEQQIASMARQIEELRRKAEQGSQQSQGEAQELHLEALLRTKFSRDIIEPVPKGEFGGDVLHRIVGPADQPCGSILWESKRTKNFSEGWLPKLRDDQRKAGADIAIIVTSALPRGMNNFELLDGVWVTESRCAIPVAEVLRHSLISIASARQASEGQQTKMELMYRYLTGAQFRHRVSAVVERFMEMQSDLERERRSTMKQWAKREQQMRGVIDSMAGMVGDLQGIAGKAIQEIEIVAMPLLEAGEEGANDERFAAV
jgi:hypothetical protein